MAIERIDDLTIEERAYLAMHARYESDRQNDPRYALTPGWEERKARWREIADSLHDDPWGPQP